MECQGIFYIWPGMSWKIVIEGEVIMQTGASNLLSVNALEWTLVGTVMSLYKKSWNFNKGVLEVMEKSGNLKILKVWEP